MICRSAAALSLSLSLLAAAPSFAAEDKVDLATVHRIKSEAFENSKVMDHLFWLTDANGPRLTNSPGFRAAADWSVRSLKAWGAANAHQEKWGTFGRGWSMTRFSAAMVEPAFAPLPGVPKAWSGGTRGAVTSEVVLAPLFQRSERDERRDLKKIEAHIRDFIARNKGKLHGKIVLLEQARDLELPKDNVSERYDEARLGKLLAAPEPIAAVPFSWPITEVPADPKKRRAMFEYLPLEVSVDYWERLRHAQDPLLAFLRDEGVTAAFLTDERGDGGLVFAESTGAWDVGAPIPPPVVVFAPEIYNRLARLAEHSVPVKVELNLEARFHEEEPAAVNVIGEIPGGSKKDEVVMLGAHLDSWHGGTGATDNAAGCAVVLEAFRILKTLGLPMDRTVRLALWSGEEQGLYGSRGYVKEHFGDPITMKVKPEHARLAGYFNLDNGTGKVRGVYLQNNDMVRPVFEKWLAPFKDLGATTLTIRNTGGTDHLSFDAVGLPGFQFIQDPLDYMSRTHHSDLDVYEHLQPADLMQASAIVASFVYQAATRAEMLPRKPLPRPLPARKTVNAVSSAAE